MRRARLNAIGPQYAVRREPALEPDRATSPSPERLLGAPRPAHRAPRIAGVHHVGIVVRDLRRALPFYALLGFEVVEERENHDDPSARQASIENGGVRLQLLEYPDAGDGQAGAGMPHHVALAVEDEAALEALREALEAAGSAVQGPFDRRYCTSVYVRDPDGALVEICAPRAPQP
ncbi:MAG: VOC family protein [Methanobacteriota archaeon]